MDGRIHFDGKMHFASEDCGYRHEDGKERVLLAGGDGGDPYIEAVLAEVHDAQMARAERYRKALEEIACKPGETYRGNPCCIARRALEEK